MKYSRARMVLLTISAVIAVLALSMCPAHSGVTTRISVASDGTQGNGWSGEYYGVSISGDGRFVAFGSYASNLVPGDTNGDLDVFVRDRQTGQSERISVSSMGAQGNDYSRYCSISADGRFVAFSSLASNLVPGDTNAQMDVFVRDRQTGQTQRVSVSSDGTQGNGGSSSWPSISADGRFVAFVSYASNLVPGDTNGRYDVFVRDRQTGVTERVSVSSEGIEGNGWSGGGWGYGASISGDGRYVAFASEASNLVAGDTNGHEDIFVRDRQTGRTERASVAGDGTQGNGGSGYYGTSISADGRYVAFDSLCSNLVPGDTNVYVDIFVHDRQTGQTSRVSVASDGTQGNTWWGWIMSPLCISGGGRFVAFASYSSNLVPGDTNGTYDVFVHDRQTGVTERVSVSSEGTQGNNGSDCPFISADGRYVAFTSSATNLVPGDTNETWDVFEHDRGATGAPPPPGSTPGWTPPAETIFNVRNPYYGYTPVGRVKGQLHCHYYNDAEIEWGPFYAGMLGVGSLFPGNVVNLYAALGYDFVCITEHNHCTSDPLISFATYIQYCEEVTKGFGHVLAIGIEKRGSWLPRWDEKRYLPWDLLNNLREIIETSPTSVADVVRAIHSPDYGEGFAAVAHPNSILYPISDEAILTANPDAVSVYTAASFSDATDNWNRLLKSGLRVPTTGGNMPLFGVTEDDFTPVVGIQGFARTWVLAEPDTAEVNQESILRALKLGRFWSYRSLLPHAGIGPILRLTTRAGDGGKPIIRVERMDSAENLDEIAFVRWQKDIGASRKSMGAGTWAEYQCQGDEYFVRAEAKKGSITAYSQPVSIDWAWTSGGSHLAATSGGAVLEGIPTDLALTCALPEELPAKMPPLGYIGRAYFAHTTSGVYPPGATLTLSYEGQDVTPYGTSNLAIYRWDEGTGAWVKLTSTVDIGNALVTAPLTSAGLYTISAEIVGDTTDPTVTIHMPSDGATLTGPDVIGVQAYDNIGVLRTTFYLGHQCIGTDSTGWDGYTCEYDFGKKSAGPYTLKVTAEDVSGNTGEAQVSVNISSSGVTPTVAITSPSNAAELTGTAPITGTCADNSLVAGVFILADGIPVGEAAVTGGDWAFDLDTSLLANGPHALSAQVLDDDQNTSEQGVSVTISGPTLGSLAEAKSVADGGQARLSGRVVTFGAPGYDGAFWIEEYDRFAGIRVQGSLLPSEGDMVSASGLMTTLEGERMLVGADVLRLSSANPVPKPLAMGNKMLGGGPLGLQQGVVDFANRPWYRLENSGEMNNIGLLIATWGRVTGKGDGYLYIDDGLALRDGTLTGADENVGVRVICDPASYTVGDFLIVTGISSCFETPSGDIARRILTRKPDDVRKVYP